MKHFDLSRGGRELGAWSRVALKARSDSRNPVTLLWDAVEAMHAEQRADGARRGARLCDYSHCGCAATHEWVRSARELKSMRRGGKRGISPLPVETHCEGHVPEWRMDVYRRIDAAERVSEVA